MKNLEHLIVAPERSVRDAIVILGGAGRKVVFVVDGSGVFLGLFTDGDMRRYLFRGGDLSAPIASAMNAHPFVGKVEGGVVDLQKCFVADNRFVCPLLDDRGRLTDVIFRDDYEDHLCDYAKPKLPAEVETVVMAGGLGKRLYPYTKVLPKALIPIGDQPILTRVIRNFQAYGCDSFHLIVNHKRNLIKAYYAEEPLGCQLHFHDELVPLGPAGGLSLLRGQMKAPFFLSNCDILVNANYAELYEFHRREGNLITAVGALRDVSVPYGVIRIKGQGSGIDAIEEKPSSSYLANVGVYVLNPEVLEDIEDNQVLLITDLINRYIAEGKKVGVYPVTGQDWQDMGQLDEMEKMTESIARQSVG